MTDYKQLCAELLSELKNAIRVIYREDGTRHISSADPVIAKADAALAEPEPEPPADGEVAELVAKLRRLAPQNPLGTADPIITRAADLLERLASPACLVVNPSPEALQALKAAGPGRIELMPDGTQIIVPTERTVLDDEDYREHWDMSSTEGSECFASAIISRLVGFEEVEDYLQRWLAAYLRINSTSARSLQIKPVPVSERLPGPGDCDAEGRCWWGDAGNDEFVPSWRLCERPNPPHFTHWLPAHALPLP